MARVNAALQAFNRGLISPKSLARVDLDRVRLSAEVFNNFIPATSGSMSIRPGTKHRGSSLNDTGAEWIEFIAATDDVALLELTDEKLRIWLGSDAHNLSLLSRPAVNTTVSLSDTGWTNASTGGTTSASFATVDAIPVMTGPTTNGVEITASSQNTSGTSDGDAWHVGDNDNATIWADTGSNGSTLPSWVSVDFGSGVTKKIGRYTIRASDLSSGLDNAPKTWRLIASNFDTGTYATDTGKWTLEDSRTNETGWAVSEKRTYNTDQGDTGTVTARRHWRLYVTAADGDTELFIAEIEMFEQTGTNITQARFSSGTLTLNAVSTGALAKAKKRVIVSDTGTEHSLDIWVRRGPVTLRVGSTDGADDYISETALGTGYHNLAFTPTTNFWVTVQSSATADRIVSSLEIGDSGTVEITTPWEATDLNNIRYDQSADVVYVDCDGVQPQKIERRGTGRSWSVVEYAPLRGPFLPTRSSSAKLSVNLRLPGNGTVLSDIPFFTPEHVGALVRIFHQGQSGIWRLGARDAYTDAIKMTGISDTGTPGSDSERRIKFNVSGTYVGTITFERSIDGPDVGFKPSPSQFKNAANDTGYATDTGTISLTLDDPDDNLVVWYRARMSAYTSGMAQVTATYGGGGVTGIARVTGYNSNTSVGAEIISRFSDTGGSDNWQQGYWSEARGFPTAVSLHGGRLAHAQGGSLFLSVSDDFENFDDKTQGDAAPIIRTLGSGPVDSIQAMVSLLRLIVHTDGAELTLRSSSLDEPVTPTNSSAGTFSTNGSAAMRALKMDQRGLFVQRSRQKLFMVGAGGQSALGDYEAVDLTTLVPDLLAAGVRSVAIQRQPDNRIHCVLDDGTVALLTYEPQEEVVCWTTWSTDGEVEKAMVLPGLAEDAVYYHIRRGIGSGNDTYTKVLLHFDAADASTDVIDENAGGSSHTWTVSGVIAGIDTGESKFGGSSFLTGTILGGYTTTSDHTDFTLGSGEWTVDCWFNCAAPSGTDRHIAGQCDSAFTLTTVSWRVYRSTANVIIGQVLVGSTPFTVTGTTTFTDLVNTGWHHVAFVRTGNTLKLFIDGTQEGGNVSITGTINDSSNDLSVGRVGELNSSLWLGWIDEFRLSVGTARWTSNFTRPTRAHERIRRFLEKWALESECTGDTGLNWIMDCASSYSDTGRTLVLANVANHLEGEEVIVWGSLDTGSTPHVDLSPDTGSDFSQRLWSVDTGGDVTLTGLTNGVHHAVVGLPYSAKWKSGKLAYGAQMGTALGQQKRAPQAAVIAYNTHINGLFVGSDTGSVDPLPRVIDGAVVDRDHIFPTLDQVAFPVPADWETDPRLAVTAKAPRPATLLGVVPTVVTNER